MKLRLLFAILLILSTTGVADARGKAPNDPAPKREYNDVLDITNVHTVDVWPQARLGYVAGWPHKGKAPVRPTAVGLTFVNNRLPVLREKAIWTGVDTVYLKFGDKRASYPARYSLEFKNDMWRGNFLIESLTINIPTAEFEEMARATEISFQIGPTSSRLFGRYLVPLAELAKTLPAPSVPDSSSNSKTKTAAEIVASAMAEIQKKSTGTTNSSPSASDEKYGPKVEYSFVRDRTSVSTPLIRLKEFPLLTSFSAMYSFEGKELKSLPDVVACSVFEVHPKTEWRDAIYPLRPQKRTR